MQFGLYVFAALLFLGFLIYALVSQDYLIGILAGLGFASIWLVILACCTPIQVRRFSIKFFEHGIQVRHEYKLTAYEYAEVANLTNERVKNTDGMTIVFSWLLVQMMRPLYVNCTLSFSDGKTHETQVSRHKFKRMERLIESSPQACIQLS